MPVLEASGLIVQGHGEPRTLVVPNPAAGAGLTFTVPGAVVWRPVALTVVLAADAGVADRFLTVQYRDQTGVAFAVSGAAVAVTAGQTRTFALTSRRGTSEQAAGSMIFGPLEPALLMLGETLVLAIANVQAGDQLSAVRLRVEQWPVST